MKAPPETVGGKEALVYWERQNPTLDGIMGGFPELSERDIRDSVSFVSEHLLKAGFSEMVKPFKRVADLGAGIGRVSELVLSLFSDQIDIFEPVERLLYTANDRLCSNKGATQFNFFKKSLQEFARMYDGDNGSESRLYDLIWIQWSAMYLSNEELKWFLERVSKALSSGGFIVIKDNYSQGENAFDAEDCSYTRNLASWNSIISESGLATVAAVDQKDWYQDLYRVKMFALHKESS